VNTNRFFDTLLPRTFCIVRDEEKKLKGRLDVIERPGILFAIYRRI